MGWTDDALLEALGRYEQLCIDNRMEQNAIDSYRTCAKRFHKWRKGDYWPRGASKPKQLQTPLIVGTSDLRGEAKTYVGVVEATGKAQDAIDTTKGTPMATEEISDAVKPTRRCRPPFADRFVLHVGVGE